MDQTRREFIKKTALGSAMISLGGKSLISCKSTGRINELGIITGVLRHEINTDYKGTFEKVADIGYKYLEIGNYLGPSQDHFKDFLKEINLVPIAGGASIRAMMDEEKLKTLVEDALDMDNTPEQVYTCPGYGVIDFAEIFSYAEKAGVEYYIVEIDKHPEPIQCIQDSYDYLINLRF